MRSTSTKTMTTMNCNDNHAGLATIRGKLRLAVNALGLLALLAAALPASAQTITFKYTCMKCNPTLQLAQMLGQLATDSNTIATVQSDVPGYTNPVPIGGGMLTVESSPATYFPYGCNFACDAEFGFPGGSAAIVGSVFGLPSGSTLLTASLNAEATQTAEPQYKNEFSGATIILYVDPTILANLGMAGLPNWGSGKADLLWPYHGLQDPPFDGYLTVTFTPARPVVR